MGPRSLGAVSNSVLNRMFLDERGYTADTDAMSSNGTFTSSSIDNPIAILYEVLIVLFFDHYTAAGQANEENQEACRPLSSRTS